MLKNNNPGNIRSFIIKGKYSKPFNGETLPPDIKPGKIAGYRVFKTLPYGYRALFIILKNGYIEKGFNTIAKIFPKYAPSSDNNDPGSYIRSVEKLTGINKDTLLYSYYDLIPIVKAITKVETGTTANDIAVNEGYNLINTFTLPDILPNTSPGTNTQNPEEDKKKKIILYSAITLTLILLIYGNRKRLTKFINR